MCGGGGAYRYIELYNEIYLRSSHSINSNVFKAIKIVRHEIVCVWGGGVWGMGDYSKYEMKSIMKSTEDINMCSLI